MSDESWMAVALAEARTAAEEGEVPVGCVVVDADGRELGRGRNERERMCDPTGHAEIVALRAAAARALTWHLEGASVFVTLEPCPMCAGALVLARVARVVYGCADPKAGAIDTQLGIGLAPFLNHRFEVTRGVLADECRQVLSGFFAGLRSAKRAR